MKLIISLSMVLLLMNIEVFTQPLQFILSNLGFSVYNLRGYQYYNAIHYGIYLIVSSIFIFIFLHKTDLLSRVKTNAVVTLLLSVGNVLIIAYMIRNAFISNEAILAYQYALNFGLLLLAFTLIATFIKLEPVEASNTVTRKRYVFFLGFMILLLQFHPFEVLSMLLNKPVPFIHSDLFKLLVSGLIIFVFIKITNINTRINNHPTAYIFLGAGLIVYIAFLMNSKIEALHFLDKGYYISILSELLLFFGFIQVLLNLKKSQPQRIIS